MKKKQTEIFFVTGTDTGIGKTLTTAILLRKESQQHDRVAGLKPIASGCYKVKEELRNVDAEVLLRSASISLPYHIVNPMAFLPPVSPHLCIRKNRSIAKMVSDSKGFARNCLIDMPADLDLLLVEGAGGWRAPLTDTQFFSELARYFTTKIIVVVGIRLGCLNHAQLTIEAIQRDGCEVVGWVANCVDKEMALIEDNIATLEKNITAPRLMTIPCLPAHEYQQELIDSYHDSVAHELHQVDQAIQDIDFHQYQSLIQK